MNLKKYIEEFERRQESTRTDSRPDGRLGSGSRSCLDAGCSPPQNNDPPLQTGLYPKRMEECSATQKDLDRFQHLYDVTVRQICGRYVDGAVDFVHSKCQSLSERIARVEGGLQHLWTDGSQEAYEQAQKMFKEWCHLWLNGIDLYNREFSCNEQRRKD